MQAVQIQNGYFIAFKRGEEFLALLRDFCEEIDVHWARFQAIGAIEDVEIGYYDLTSKQYVFRREAGPFEVGSMSGNISEVDERPVIHTHAVLTRCDESLETIGGHLNRARVALTLEMSLALISQPLTRRYDDETGLNLLNLESA